MATEGTLLWEPSTEWQQDTQLFDFMHWLRRNKGLSFRTYDALWAWSVTDTEAFWGNLWEYFHIRASEDYRCVLEGDVMPDIHWFPGAKLNYAEHVFRNAKYHKPALIFQSEHKPFTEVSWTELKARVGALAASLQQFGVAAGDRVASCMPNIPETVIAFLACASIGAVWSSCPPDLGVNDFIDRFQQIEPKVLFTVDGYCRHGKSFDRLSALAELQQKLPTISKTIVVPYLQELISPDALNHMVLWDDVTDGLAELTFEQVPFEHPLWILYSSEPTGVPKAIVQGHGGIVMEHLKVMALQFDVKPSDRFFWFTKTGGVMWNILMGALLTGAAVVLYDGSPAYPNAGVLWDIAERGQVTHFGTSASYLSDCIQAGMKPGETHHLSTLRFIGSAGLPLKTEGFQWVYQHVKSDVWLACVSGGTDVCSGFVGPCPAYPVRAGEIQCRLLGSKAEAFDGDGQPAVGEVGELVVTKPMPSMPLFFWNDPHKTKYRERYFDMYPGYWKQGDSIQVKRNGACVLYGRSDSRDSAGSSSDEGSEYRPYQEPAHVAVLS